MRAIRCTAWGELDTIALEDVPPPPPPGPGQVALDIAAAGVNFADILMITGKYQERPLPPFSPGLEVAGIVSAVGEGVGRFKPGDRVLALLDHGGFAEKALAAESDVFAIPDAMGFAEAAGFAIAYGTSYGALVWRAALQPGELLLVLGAAGGVGLTAVEIGKALGARVIACAGGAEKLAIAKAHGADHLIDYQTENIRGRVREIAGLASAIGGAGADVVYDPVGGDSFDAALRAVNWSARLLVVGFAGGRVQQIPANILLVKNLAVHGIYWGSYRRHDAGRLAPAFAEMFGWWRQGKLKPLVSARLDLAEAKQALHQLSERKATGKVVLTTALAEAPAKAPAEEP
jgi:NADPH2:quinone reductase